MSLVLTAAGLLFCCFLVHVLSFSCPCFLVFLSLFCCFPVVCSPGKASKADPHVISLFIVQLKAVLQNAISDNPALCKNIRGCLQKCQSLQQQISAPSPSTSRHMLLRALQDELKEYSSSTRTLTRSHTAKETKAQPRPSMRPRRSSVGASHAFSSPLAQIGEDNEETDMLLQSSSRATEAADKSSEKGRVS